MNKPLLFYIIHEFTDIETYCKRKGLIPYKYKEMSTGIEGDPVIKIAVQYIKEGYIYDVLEEEQCRSECMAVLMRLPKLTYEKLLSVALNSKYSDERIGSIGIILKDYPNEFEQFLTSMLDADTADLQNKKNIKRISKYVYNLINESYLIRDLENMRDLCEKLRIKLK